MSETKHTPEPWIVGQHMNIEGPDPFCGRVIIASVGNSNGIISSGEQKANAQLIAAAPEMLAALKWHHAWAVSEAEGPNYEGMTRATHPEGEVIWSNWWSRQLHLCSQANAATAAALIKAEGTAQ